MNRVLNLKKSPIDERDYKVKLSPGSQVKVKGATDLSAFMTPVKDQGNIGSCTAFAVLGNMEFLQKRFLSKITILSEKFTYWATRVDVAKWNGNEDSGAYLRDAIKSVVKFGSCLNSVLPYDKDYKSKPNQNVYVEAKKYTALIYARIDENNIDVLKANLDAGFPVVAGFICFNNLFSKNSSRTGIIPLPLPKSRVVGGHALLLVGYNDKTKLFKCKNSWNLSGDKGYWYLPYDYYLKGNIFDIWCVYVGLDNLKEVGLDITNPILIKKQIQENVNDILTSITKNIEKITNKKEYEPLFTSLLDKYKGNIKIISFINSLKESIDDLQ